MNFLLKQVCVVLFIGLFSLIPFQADAAMVGQGDFEFDFSGDIQNTDITLIFYDGLVGPGSTYTEIQRLYASFDTNLTASITITPTSNPEIFGTLTDGNNDQITHLFDDGTTSGYLGSGASEVGFFYGETLNNIDFAGYTLSEVVFSFTGDTSAQKIIATITAYGDPVPVPSSFLLFTAGLLGLSGMRKKQGNA